jgi:hypothetical protein
LTSRFSGIAVAIASVLFGLLIGPLLEKISDPLFDTPTKALLSGFACLALILIATATAISIHFHHHDRKFDEFAVNLRDAQNHIKLTTSLENVGISGAVVVHTWEMLDSFCSEASDEIRVLQSYLGSVQQLPPCVFNAPKRGVTVRLLLLDPDKDIIRHRLTDIGYPPEMNVHQDAIARLRNTLERLQPAPERFQVRLYNRIPPFVFYNADRRMRLGFFWHGVHSFSGPHIFVGDKDSAIGRHAVDTFEEIWKDSKPFTWASKSPLHVHTRQ